MRILIGCFETEKKTVQDRACRRRQWLCKHLIKCYQNPTKRIEGSHAIFLDNAVLSSELIKKTAHRKGFKSYRSSMSEAFVKCGLWTKPKSLNYAMRSQRKNMIGYRPESVNKRSYVSPLHTTDVLQECLLQFPTIRLLKIGADWGVRSSYCRQRSSRNFANRLRKERYVPGVLFRKNLWSLCPYNFTA